MYRYETHLHTAPVSKCAKRTVEESLLFYQSLGYAGVFITNHFIDGNINMDKTLPYEDLIRFYFSDLEEGKRLGAKMGFPVFGGVEMSYKRTDFLVYGPDMEWYLRHPEICGMEKHELLPFLMEEGALVIQAHPFREGKGIHYMRLYPSCVHGVEIYNACRKERENRMAKIYAEEYGLLPFAGSDNHRAEGIEFLGGMESEEAITDEWDFVRRVKEGKMNCFQMKNPLFPEVK